MTIIIGIDPGTTVTGYCVVQKDTSGLSVLDCGCIRPPAKEKTHERCKIIHEAVVELISTYSPTAMAIETQFVHEKNPQAGITIGMARGVISLAASLASIAIYEYAPKQIKQAATGNGNASKQQVKAMMQHYFQLTSLPYDAADALAAAVCYYQDSEYKAVLCMHSSVGP